MPKLSRLAGLSWSWKIRFTILEDNVGKRLTSHSHSPHLNSPHPFLARELSLPVQTSSRKSLGLSTWGCSASAGQLLHTQEVGRRHRETSTIPWLWRADLDFPFSRRYVMLPKRPQLPARFQPLPSVHTPHSLVLALYNTFFPRSRPSGFAVLVDIPHIVETI